MVLGTNNLQNEQSRNTNRHNNDIKDDFAS